ncbi:hypothetical protein [Winogradskyella sp.]|uniref:hypothetical protein n=2 Tax=Winogradskyella sp. TaxID=1883156 RepID=UPI0035139E6C
MISALYFMISFVAILLFCVYFVAFGIGSVALNNASQPNIFQMVNAKDKLKGTLSKTSEIENKALNINSPKQFQVLDLNFEIKKQSHQLRRNLKTLDYISRLEANAGLDDNAERLEEIKNLKNGVQRQIIKNTSLLNKYRLM